MLPMNTAASGFSLTSVCTVAIDILRNGAERAISAISALFYNIKEQGQLVATYLSSAREQSFNRAFNREDKINKSVPLKAILIEGQGALKSPKHGAPIIQVFHSCETNFSALRQEACLPNPFVYQTQMTASSAKISLPGKEPILYLGAHRWNMIQKRSESLNGAEENEQLLQEENTLPFNNREGIRKGRYSTK